MRDATIRRIPLFNDVYGTRAGSYDMFGPGFILDGAAFDDGGVYCSFTGDGQSFMNVCTPAGLSARCIPGCMRDPPAECTWCMETSSAATGHLPCKVPP